MGTIKLDDETHALLDKYRTTPKGEVIYSKAVRSLLEFYYEHKPEG